MKGCGVKTCPPCSGNCRQGRDCHNRVSDGDILRDVLCVLFWPVYVVSMVAIGVWLWP